MPRLHVKASRRNSLLFQNSSNPQRIQSHKSLLPLVRFLASGLAFFVPLLLPVFALAADVTLAWDPNTDSDLEGYGVYFKKDSPGPPYDFFGYVAVQDLSDPNNPTFTLTGLEEGSQYYFVATAYDLTGNESGYSNSVCAEMGDPIVPCASDGGAAVSTGSSGGGGGGGCFIETSLNHGGPHSIMGSVLFAGVIFAMGWGRFSRKKFFKR
jgi:hypothetical protein